MFGWGNYWRDVKLERERWGENWSEGCLVFLGWGNEGENGGAQEKMVLINYIVKVLTTFMRNIKSCQKKLIILLFSYKMFIKIVSKLTFLGIHQHFPWFFCLVLFFFLSFFHANRVLVLCLLLFFFEVVSYFFLSLSLFFFFLSSSCLALNMWCYYFFNFSIKNIIKKKNNII